MIDDLVKAKSCIDFQNIKCGNLDCKRFICPLNRKFVEYVAELKILKKKVQR